MIKNTNIQWFPGHMKKARQTIQENLKLVDLVIELLDARVPLSSQNPLIQEIIKGKDKLIVLSKADLASSNDTESWLKKFRAENITAVAIDAVNGTGTKKLITSIENLVKSKIHKFLSKGINVRAARVMVVGIPNVGKSTLINCLSKMNQARVENRPGITRNKQWIRLSNSLLLLDMPGILWTKFDDPQVALKLSWIYAVSDEIHDLETAVGMLLRTLAIKSPKELCRHYKLDEIPTDIQTLLNRIGMNQGCMVKGGVVDIERTSRMILSDFRSGRLGRITLDEI